MLIMGITGLLKFVKDATDTIHIKKYSGKTVAVDTYCWIHRGSFACAEKLAKHENTDQYVRYCLKFIDMLESYHVKPVLVFDGCRLPSKELVEQERHKRRKENLEKGKQFLREGKLSAARDCFTKCISVTPAMALRVIEAARARGIDCIVAPYEADAQLAHFAKTGKVQAIVTEDSDLLCFGCTNVIFKMDLTGRAQEVCTDNLGRVKNLAGFTPDLFRHMCILSGCDYLPSVKGVGLVKACKALKLSKSRNSYQVASRLHQYIKGLSPVDPNYGSEFERADKTFLYQLVFDPYLRKLKPLNDYPETINANELEFAGPYISDEKAIEIALGNIDINTGLVIGYFDIDVWIAKRKPVDNLPSIWYSTTKHNFSSERVTETTTGEVFKEKKIPKGNEKVAFSSDVVTAVMEDNSNIKNNFQEVTKNKTPSPLSSSLNKVSTIKKVVGGDIMDLLQTYSDTNKTISRSIQKSPAKVVKSRFFASPNTSNTPKDFEIVSSFSVNNSDSLFSDVKSSEDSALTDILTEMTAHADKLVTPPRKRVGNASTGSHHKKRKTIPSSYEELEHFSNRRKKKKLNIPTATIFHQDQSENDQHEKTKDGDILHDNITASFSHAIQIEKSEPENSKSNEILLNDIQDEAIPFLDDIDASVSLFGSSNRRSLSSQDSHLSLCEKSINDECIPILDSDSSNKSVSPRQPLGTITNENTLTIAQPSKNVSLDSNDCVFRADVELSSKCRSRRLGLPSTGKFTKSPIKLNLSKYFSGSKASGLRKTKQKVSSNQKSILSFFRAKS